MKKAIMIIFLCSGCCPAICRPNIVNYDTDNVKVVYSPHGVKVVTNGNYVDDRWFAELERIIMETSKCVAKAEPKYSSPKLSCWHIYLVPDWRWSCNVDSQGKRYQLFGYAPQEACEQKGFKEDINCPCGWRIAVINKRWIAVPPDLRMLSAGVIELQTGWPQHLIWQNKKLAGCYLDSNINFINAITF